MSTLSAPLTRGDCDSDSQLRHRGRHGTSNSSQPSPNLNNHCPICIGLLSSLVLILHRLKDFQVDQCCPDGRARPQTIPVCISCHQPNGNNEVLRVSALTGEPMPPQRRAAPHPTSHAP
ncbi:hypothetical protein PGT21_002561 [Puccinia graminis f. sp. tritici]|uniref:Uncharacterized protein n=1 Tax=Puccinia graminis f. sp. tritici TaxID=56615 RepID=A0A5B0P7A8_PUCGR|nr:hypothetical protein PGT21_002561 [Puccinia graminis f. sp. tritici]KAA1134342.1 hypothetical protein PGTUg99_035412 [Puccinia graminis f. sp. tritici]